MVRASITFNWSSSDACETCIVSHGTSASVPQASRAFRAMRRVWIRPDAQHKAKPVIGSPVNPEAQHPDGEVFVSCHPLIDKNY